MLVYEGLVCPKILLNICLSRNMRFSPQSLQYSNYNAFTCVKNVKKFAKIITRLLYTHAILFFLNIVGHG